ncbi:hypothetical protein PENSPDRAFT_689517 [Peniophora sp. CONT]|nr:hypothetical protein PENSPDRAFT_689517 [Peniophora sp. CONT]
MTDVEAKIAEIEKRWWSYSPVVAAVDVIELTFIDATDGAERWEPERVPCSASESFAHAAQRFRVSANKKYRHPFLPAYHFDLLLDTGRRATFDSFDSRTVADVIGDKYEVSYERNDEGEAQAKEEQETPSKYFEPWDRARLLPSWCTAPDSWFEPAPPPGFFARRVKGKEYYLKVPTLHIPCAGIRSPMLQPQIITRFLYLPVTGDVPTAYLPNDEKNYVPVSNRLIPTALTVNTARSLLGRYVQYSKDRGSKKSKPTSVGVAWGLSLDNEGRPDWMHCLNRRFGRANVIHANCGWVGAVILDVDMRVSEEVEKEDEDEDEDEDVKRESQDVQKDGSEGEGGNEERESFNVWYEKAQRWIGNLNTEDAPRLVEVGQDGTFLAGDVESAKGDDGDWELSIPGVKPGVWRMSVFASSHVQFIWDREGAVDYDALPTSSGDMLQSEIDDDNLEELGMFTVDSGKAALFSQSVFDSLTSGDEREAKIETLIDAAIDGRGDEEYVPGGVVVNGDDGTYVVEGTRAGDGIVVAVRMRPLE